MVVWRGMTQREELVATDGLVPSDLLVVGKVVNLLCEDEEGEKVSGPGERGEGRAGGMETNPRARLRSGRS